MSFSMKSEPSSSLGRKVLWKLTPAHILLAGIILISVFLHFANLQAIGDANTYYAAAVKSMLQSWHNFFFVSAEPGGSVTVDKPPLGLWVEAAFALVLGVKGWTVSLPNILSGIFSVPLLYHLVKKHLGEIAGLTAALVLVVTPVAIATDRNNTMDGMLVFTLLLAAWAFLKATENGRLRWLLLGGLLMGLGFNIKMLQAFLPLPAFYALYFLGGKAGWGRKFVQVALATLLMLIVSLSWAVAVDLTPAAQRPYIGSSQDNTVMELIIGHNGLSRLFGGRRGQNSSHPDDGAPGVSNQPPAGNRPPDGFADGPNAGPGGTPFSNETGSPGIARFFVAPLSKQMSWLLPFALLSVFLMAFAAHFRLPLTPEHQALVLWGGWLLTCLVFFSVVKGIFHSYYAIMLAPALGGVVGGGFGLLWRQREGSAWASFLLMGSAAVTLIFQFFMLKQYGGQSSWFFGVILLFLSAIALAWKSRWRASYWLVLAALLIIPMIWTTMTVFDAAPEVNLPTAYAGTRQTNPTRPTNVTNQTNLLNFLQAHTQGIEYLVAVPNAHTGAWLVLATGRPVLYMGGFGGGDAVIDAAGLAELVANGDLRYVLFSGAGGKQDIAGWLNSACSVVPEFSSRQASGNGRPGVPGGRNAPGMLYICEP